METPTDRAEAIARATAEKYPAKLHPLLEEPTP